MSRPGAMPASPSPVLARVLPTERLLFASDVACAGTFSCGVEDPLFGGGAPSTAHCIVFSRTPVWIQHEAGVRYVADATRVTFHNRGRAYRRWQIDTRGDRCRWIAYAPDVVSEIVGRWDPAHVDAAPDTPFRFQFAAAAAPVYLRQHQMFQGLAGAGAADSRLPVEEEALTILGLVAAAAYDREGGCGTRASALARRDFDAVQHVRGRIAAAPAAAHALRPLAAEVNLSPYRLCRAFTRVCGETLTAHRLRLRLLGSLDAVCAGADLTGVALAWGFASHSHFTAAFRRMFGDVPSALRASRSARYRAAAISRSRKR